VRFALAIVVTLSLCGCSQDGAHQSPTAPTPASPAPTPASPTWLWGYVVDAGGGCIEGATVQVVAGQGVGEKVTQTTPCDAWAYGGGFVFNNLIPGVEMTLRASAPDWSTCDYAVTPHSGSQMAVILPLTKAGACQSPWDY
jgi:hypothetical protein